MTDVNRPSIGGGFHWRPADRADWLNRLLRWAFGTVFIVVGVSYLDDGAWPALLFGAIFMITGFLRPRRCTEDACDIPDTQAKTRSLR